MNVSLRSKSNVLCRTLANRLGQPCRITSRNYPHMCALGAKKSCPTVGPIFFGTTELMARITQCWFDQKTNVWEGPCSQLHGKVLWLSAALQSLLPLTRLSRSISEVSKVLVGYQWPLDEMLRYVVSQIVCCIVLSMTQAVLCKAIQSQHGYLLSPCIHTSYKKGLSLGIVPSRMPPAEVPHRVPKKRSAPLPYPDTSGWTIQTYVGNLSPHTLFIGIRSQKVGHKDAMLLGHEPNSLSSDSGASVHERCLRRLFQSPRALLRFFDNWFSKVFSGQSEELDRTSLGCFITLPSLSPQTCCILFGPLPQPDVQVTETL